VRIVRLLVAALAVAPTWATAQAKPGGSQLPAARTSTRTPTLSTPPKLIQLPAAQLPPDTVYPAPEVSVLLGLDVTATGTVARATLVEGLGEPFDGAAVAAARGMTFTPALLDTGDAVPVRIQFRMRLRAPVVETVTETATVAPPPREPVVVHAGVLIERGTRRPIAAAPVSAERDGVLLAEAVTDERGRFSLEVGTSTFTLFGEPYTHERLEQPGVQANAGQAETYYLVRRTNPYTVDVRDRALKREVAKRVISRDVIRNAAGTQGDALKVVQNLPGVARPSFGGGPLVLRGATPGDSRTFLEGQEIPQIFHFGGLRSTFASAFLESIELVPGNFGPDYGRAIGGVVDVRVRDPARDLFRGEVDVNFFDAGFALEGPITEKLSLGGGFRRSYIDTILPAVIPDDASVSFDTAPRYYDYQLIAAYKVSEDHTLRGFYYGSMDKIELLFADPGADPKVRGTLSARTMFHNVQLESKARLSDTLSQETSLKAGISGLQFLLGPDFYFDLDVQTISLRSAWSLKLGPPLTLRVGTDSRVQVVQIGLSAPSPPKEGETPIPVSVNDTLGVTQEATLFEPALFAELIWRPTPELQILPSLRLDYYSAIEAVTLDPRVSAQYRFDEAWTARAGVGLHQQQPQYDESDEVTGTPGLLPSRSLQLSLGLEHVPTAGISVELTGFYKALDQIVTRGTRFGQDPEAPAFTNEGTGRIFGLELLAKATFPDVFTGWVTYTFQRSFRTDNPSEDERVFDFDQPHILTVVGTFELGAGWTAGGRFRLVSGNPDAPATGSVYDAYADVYIPQFGAKTERLGTFHQLDLRVDKTWTFELWKLNLYLDVQNVYNRGNQEGWRYSFDYRQREAVTGLPIFPVLGVRGEW
jgi:hypothetical protein